MCVCVRFRAYIEIRRTREDWSFEVPKCCVQIRRPRFERVWTNDPETQTHAYHGAVC